MSPHPAPQGLITASRRGGNRHALYRIDHEGQSVILKIYGPKRGAIRDALRGLGHRWISRKTGMRPSLRRRTERDLLELWQSLKFRVPRVLDIRLPQLEADPRPYLVLEDVGGSPVRDLLFLPDPSPDPDPDGELDHLDADLEAFASSCARRHRLARERDEPRLVHTHPGFTHVLDVPEVAGEHAEWVTIDFEHAFRPGSPLERLVEWELGRWLFELERPGGARARRLRAAFEAGYPDCERLQLSGRRRPVAPWLPLPRPALGRKLPGSARKS